MAYWLVLCLCFWMTTCGTPYTTERCTRVNTSRIRHHNDSDGVVVLLWLNRDANDRDSAFIQKLCDGTIDGHTFITWEPCGKELPCLKLRSTSHGSLTVSEVVRSLTESGVGTSRIRYTCTKPPHLTVCLDITANNKTVAADNTASTAHLTYRPKRDVSPNHDTVRTTLGDGGHSVLPGWVMALAGVAMGVIILSLAVVLCVKSEPNEVNLTQTSGLKIIDGPPTEYLEAKKKASVEGASNVQITENHNDLNNTMSQEARVRFSQLSTSPPPITASMSDERTNNHQAVGRATSHDPTQKPKKATDPLPPTPNSQPVPEGQVDRRGEDQHQDDEEEENPYDIADTDKGGSDNVDGVGSNPAPPPLPGGSYAKVSRVPDHNPSGANGDSMGSYAEISQVKQHHHQQLGRLRSSTEPVDPLPPLPPPITKPRTFSGNDTLPNLTTPTGEHPPSALGGSRTPDVNLIVGGLMEDEKVYDSLDDDDNDEMYESVPEDLKEELTSGHSTAAPVPLPAPRSPKATDTITFSGSSPSPTKHPFTATPPTPDSPTAKKAGKKGGKKRNSHIEDDSHNQKKSTNIFNRFRSNSSATPATNSNKGTNATATRKEKKELPTLASPDHTHLTQPVPPIPTTAMYNEGDDDDDDDTGMYDSVDRDMILQDVKLRSSTLPLNVGGGGIRTSIHFSPRVAEPLPEVPEDSGSGSKNGAGLVQHEREQEGDDPNYDIVTGAMKMGRGGEDPPLEEDEDNYDTVRPRGQPLANSGGNSPATVGHNYAKVSTHGTKQESIDHDDQGYALVDASVLERKRTASLSKTAVQQEQGEGDQKEQLADDEPPYDKIKISEDDREVVTDDDPPYDKVKKGDGSEDIGEEGSETVDDEPPYDKIVLKDDDESPYDRIDNDPSYDLATRMDDDEPPYDKVRIGDGSEDIGEEGSETVDDEPPYDKVRIGDGSDEVDGPENIGEGSNDDHGYASVRKFGSRNNSTIEQDDLTSTDGSTNVSGGTGLSINFETETIVIADVQDTTYSHVNLAKKHELRKLREKDQSMDQESTDGAMATTQPDDNMINEDDVILNSPGSEPPPIPSPFVGTPGTMTPSSLQEDYQVNNNGDKDDDDDDDPNYDVVKPRLFNNSSNREGGIPRDPSGGGHIDDNSMESNTSSTNAVVGSPTTVEQVVYDSLDPKPVASTPLYDTLEEVMNHHQSS